MPKKARKDIQQRERNHKKDLRQKSRFGLDMQMEQIPRHDSGYSAEDYLKRVGDYTSYAMAAARKYNVPYELLLAQMFHESRGKPNAVSPANAYGLMQVRVPTGKEMGFSEDDIKNNPYKNVMAGAAYMRKLADRYNADIDDPDTMQMVLTAYNAGPGGQRRMARNGAPINTYARDIWNGYNKIRQYQWEQAMRMADEAVRASQMLGTISPASHTGKAYVIP